MTHTITRVPVPALDLVMEDAMRLLKPAIDMSSGRHNEMTVIELLYAERFQLWTALDDTGKMVGALTTQIEDYPLKRMLMFTFIGGEILDSWRDPMMNALEDFAKATGCAGMELVGRYGWKRFMKDYGWDARHVICEYHFGAEEQEEAA